jgi:hypothetical protein
MPSTRAQTTPAPPAPSPSAQSTPSAASTGSANNSPAASQHVPPSNGEPAADRTGESTAARTSPAAQQVPSGVQITATLDQALSTKNSQVGDSFTATVSQPVRGSGGIVLIPAGSKINGKVSESEQGKTLPSIRGRGHLNVRFVDITFPEHVSSPLTATLVSVHPKGGNGKAGEEGEVTSGTSGKNTAKDVGIGAGVGTLAGFIFGSALKGLAIGAIAGGGYVLATDGKDVELPAQTEITVRLDQNLTVPAAVAQDNAQGRVVASPRSPASH